MPKAKERDGVYYRKDRGIWSVSYIDASGQRVRQKVEAHTRQQAIDALRRIKTKEELARTLGVRPASEITLEALFERYKRHQKARIRPTTFARLGGILDTLKAHLPELAKAITKRTVAEYIEARAVDVKPGTVAKEMSVLKHCLKLAVEWGELNQNPAAGARLPQLSPGKTRFLTPGELKAALESAPEWLRAPMAFAACTGVRRGELLSLRWMDVDMDNRRLYLRETKNGALRVLPIPEFALTVLRSLSGGADSDTVFAGVNPAHLSVYTKRVFKRLGIPDASFHTLRHTAASWLVMKGVDLYVVGQILGHKTPRMTQRYAHLSPDYMAGAVGRLDRMMMGMLAAKNAEASEAVQIRKQE
ncbi:MAG: site-specific integrase [Terracidiphilus sp.]|jgi:integrase